MSIHQPPDQLSERDRRDLVALADGSLPTGRRVRLERRIAASPELRAALAGQRQAVGALRAVDVNATTALRNRIATGRARRDRARRRLVVRAGLGATAAVAVIATGVALLVAGGQPAVDDVTRLASLSATAPAPAPRPDEPALLDAEAEGLAFPNWDAPELGWRAFGRRSDELDGRSTETVFYDKGGSQIAYTIVSGAPLDPPPDARPATRDGVQLASFRDDGRLAVTWLRDGHTCVLSGTDVDRATLLKLAAWKGDGAVVF